MFGGVCYLLCLVFDFGWFDVFGVWLIAWSMGLLASWFLVGFLKMFVVSWFGLVTVGGGCFALVVLVIVDWCLWIS